MSKHRKTFAPQADQGFNRNDFHESDKPQEETTDSPEHLAAVRKSDAKKHFSSMSDRLAEDTLFYRNHKWAGADKYFPNKDQHIMRIVSKFYPYARGGELLIDEPNNEAEMIFAYEKQKFFKQNKLGFRHVVIEPNDTKLDLLLEQLGEL